MEVIPPSVVPLAGVNMTMVSTTTTAEIPSETPLTTLEKTIEIEKSMEEMTLRGTEIDRLKKEVENL
jgi:hypothetical protein